MVRRRNSSSAEEDARFQGLFPNLSRLTSGRTSGHQKLVSTFPWIDNCLMVTKSLKVGCLSCAVGKQPSIPLINLGRTWTLKWWWWNQKQKRKKVKKFFFYLAMRSFTLFPLLPIICYNEKVSQTENNVSKTKIPRVGGDLWTFHSQKLISKYFTIHVGERFFPKQQGMKSCFSFEISTQDIETSFQSFPSIVDERQDDSM